MEAAGGERQLDQPPALHTLPAASCCVRVALCHGFGQANQGKPVGTKHDGCPWMLLGMGFLGALSVVTKTKKLLGVLGTWLCLEVTMCQMPALASAVLLSLLSDSPLPGVWGEWAEGRRFEAWVWVWVGRSPAPPCRESTDGADRAKDRLAGGGQFRFSHDPWRPGMLSRARQPGPEPLFPEHSTAARLGLLTPQVFCRTRTWTGSQGCGPCPW